MIGRVSDLEPFFLPLDGLDGSRFHATGATAGPWFAHAQHGGPPSALLVRAMERCPGGAGAPTMRLARVTVELLGPVPVGEVEVSARTVRTGRTVELLEAQLVAGGRPAMLARAWRHAAADTAAVQAGQLGPIPGPDTAPLMEQLPPHWLPGFMEATEWRWQRGRLDECGPGTAWIRQRVPLVDGEDPTGLQRLAVVADCANGVSAPLDVATWLFLNTELTLHVHRAPAGEWLAVDATTTIGPDGAGTVSAALFDQDGHTARAAQALTVRPR